MKYIIIILVPFLFANSLFSQITHLKRIEFDLNEGTLNRNVFLFGSDGFILKFDEHDKKNDQKNWKYDLYNTDLNVVKSVPFRLSASFYHETFYLTSTSKHSFFSDLRGNFSLVSVSVPDLELIKIEGKTPKNFEPRKMVVMGDIAYLTGTEKKQNLLYAINWKTGEQSEIPISISGVSQKEISLGHFQVLENFKEVFLYVYAQVDKKERDIYAFQLDASGGLIRVTNLSKNTEANLSGTSATKINKNTYLFTGTFSTGGTKSSKGIFLCKLEEGNIKYLRQQKFVDLPNFFSFLPQNVGEKMEKKRDKKEKKRKELIVNYLMASHDIISIDDGYLLFGEIFHPVYEKQSYTRMNQNGQAVTAYKTVLLGYRLTHALIVRFDLNGQPIWDQSFEMNPIPILSKVRPHITIKERNESSVKLQYAVYNQISSVVIGFDGNIKENKSTTEVSSHLPSDQTKRTFSDIDYWYDNHFILFGEQKIKREETNQEKSKKKVFFISKLQFSEE